MYAPVLTLLCSVFILATSVAAQGREGVTRGQIFFGCYTARPTGSANQPAPIQAANSASFAGCLNNCGALSTPQLFGYWQQSTNLCWCGSLLQFPQSQQTSNAPCPTAQWTYGRVSTTFTTFGTSPCRSFANVNYAASAYTQVAGPVSCHRQCRSNRFAYFWGDTANGNVWRCACSNDVRVSQTQAFTCAAGSVFVFEHSPLAQASALDRKKKRDDLLVAEQALVSLCPGGMAACTVPGIDGAYECLDTSSELESCGGCLHGQLYSNGTLDYSGPGSDCTAAGAAMGAATCINGQCQVTHCQEGYELLEGYCLPILGRRTIA